MSTDYQILEVKGSARVTKTGLYSKTPFTLDIVGINFRDVIDVKINGYKSPEFIVVSPTRILAQVPRSQASAVISTVVVSTETKIDADSALISFTAVPSAGKQASGSVKLAQIFLKILFTSPGTDIFAPNIGGGLLDLIGSAKSPGVLTAIAKTAVSSTQKQLVRIQSGITQLDRNEKLSNATLLQCTFDPQTGTLALRVRLTAVDGSTVDASSTV
jgi:phage baseplate assembly protein W